MAIQRYHGDKTTVPKGETAMSSMTMSKARSIYTRKYKNKNPPLIRTWTQRMESKLIRLERGEINDIQETSIYSNAKKTNEEYLAIRLQAVSEQTRLRVMKRLYDDVINDNVKSKINLYSKVQKQKPTTH